MTKTTTTMVMTMAIYGVVNFEMEMMMMTWTTRAADDDYATLRRTRLRQRWVPRVLTPLTSPTTATSIESLIKKTKTTLTMT